VILDHMDLIKDSTDATEDKSAAPRPSRRRLIGTAAAGVAVGVAGVTGAQVIPAYAGGPPTAAPAPSATAARRFEGKVVLITGATSGIGRATALAFAREGAKLGFCGRRENLGAQVEREIKNAGGEATYLRADVRQPDQLRSFVDRIAAKYGRLDVAFNNAGITITDPLHELTVEEWDDVQNTNARGVFLAIKYEVPHLLKAGGGVIICTSSGSTRPGGTAYTASKRAVVGIVEAASLDYGTQGVRVNALLPGTTDTPFVRPSGLPDVAWTAFKNAWGPLNVSALQRMATPEEVARSVVSLATDEFSYMTGSAVELGGGPARGGRMRMPPGFPAR
jgi:NAD(P)-dependent dehydrogenase (short-subunit alcohol dehydrogenase family)